MGLIHLFGSQRDTKKSDEKWTANLLRLPLTRDKEWRIYGRESMYSVLWSLAGNGQAFFAIKDKWNKNGRWKSRIVTDATGSEAGLAFVRPEAGVRVAGDAIRIPPPKYFHGRSCLFTLEVLFARVMPEAKAKTEREKPHRYICPLCGQEVKTTADLSIICGHCEVPMERND